MKETENRSIYYPDIWIFLVSIPLINAVNYYLTYTNIHFNLFLLLTYSIDTAEGFLAWLAVRKIIFYLDRQLPFSPNPVKRIFIQVVFTSMAGLLIIALCTELISLIVRKRPAGWNFYTIDMLIIGIWFIVINGVYIVLYFYRKWLEAELEKDRSRIGTGYIPLKTGNQNTLVKFEDISLICIDSDYVQIVQKNNKKYFCDQSLDKLEKTLPKNVFFRINRQFIVHRQTVSGFKRIENGKLLVMLNTPSDFTGELIVSRTKSPAFKKWLLPV